ncbi:hypothetical protein PLESTM_000988000 [Pleodorina starrii]|nr:hypothetical protein PLESTM_000988000 [Pleodorina starrii]
MEQAETSQKPQARLPIPDSVFGRGYPAQAASIEYAPAPPLYHSRRAPGLPHLFHFTDQEQDMLSGLNNYRGDLEKKRAAEARANNGIGCLLK